MSARTWQRRLGGLAGAVALAVPLLLASPTAAQAERNPACPSGVTKIGTTGHITIGGATFASVKQFKGCGKNWGYLYVWQSWRDNHPSDRWVLCVGIAVGAQSPFRMVDDRCTEETRQIELWSRGADTLSVCTHAVGARVDFSGPPSGRTDIRC